MTLNNVELKLQRGWCFTIFERQKINHRHFEMNKDIVIFLLEKLIFTFIE